MFDLWSRLWGHVVSELTMTSFRWWQHLVCTPVTIKSNHGSWSVLVTGTRKMYYCIWDPAPCQVGAPGSVFRSPISGWCLCSLCSGPSFMMPGGDTGRWHYHWSSTQNLPLETRNEVKLKKLHKPVMFLFQHKIWIGGFINFSNHHCIRFIDLINACCKWRSPCSSVLFISRRCAGVSHLIKPQMIYE